MTLDGITIHQIVRELDAALSGAKIEKIHQPQKDELFFVLHTQSGKQSLVLSSHAQDCRTHLTSVKKDNPKYPPMFCMYLRKHIGGSTITRVYQKGLERIVYFDILSRDEMGYDRPLTLVLEIMGKHSNMILIDEEGQILESIRHVSFDVSRVRQVLPGLRYIAPPSDKYNPLELSSVSLTEVLMGQEDPKSRMVRTLEGFSTLAAQEVAFRQFGDSSPSTLDEKSARLLAASVQAFLADVSKGPAQLIESPDGKPKVVIPYPYQMYHGSGGKSFPSVCTALDYAYQRKWELEVFGGKRLELERLVRKHIAKLSKKLNSQLLTLKDAQKAEKYKLYGDLITASLYQIKRGDRELSTINYYTGEPITIPLDPTLPPSANAQKSYKRYAKLKNACEITGKLAEQTKAELDFLMSVEHSLSLAETLEDLSEIREELIRQKYISQKPGTKRPKRDDSQLSQPGQFRSDSGFLILQGKNNRQNDMLTLRLADKEDIWLHAKDIPGSHIIIRTEGKTVDALTLTQAGILAATFSKAKQGSKVPVDYTQVKYVKKPSGAKPGMVIFTDNNTMVVDPDTSLAQRLHIHGE